MLPMRMSRQLFSRQYNFEKSEHDTFVKPSMHSTECGLVGGPDHAHQSQHIIRCSCSRGCSVFYFWSPFYICNQSIVSTLQYVRWIPARSRFKLMQYSSRYSSSSNLHCWLTPFRSNGRDISRPKSFSLSSNCWHYIGPWWIWFVTSSIRCTRFCRTLSDVHSSPLLSGSFPDCFILVCEYTQSSSCLPLCHTLSTHSLSSLSC